MDKPEFKEHITILGNNGEYMRVKICAKSLEAGVSKWARDSKGWYPVDIKWLDVIGRYISYPHMLSYAKGRPSPRHVYIKRELLPELLIHLGMLGVEVWSRMKRKGSFTPEEWKMIKIVQTKE